MSNNNIDFRLIPKISDLDPQLIALLEVQENPLTRYCFLHALEASLCCTSSTGWQPCHIQIQEGDRMLGVIPAYIKSHSWGEYVFDWSWAHAYQQYGIEYYPKLVSCIPFTPVPVSKLILIPNSKLTPETIWEAFHHQLPALAERTGFNSWHLLFRHNADNSASLPLPERIDCQFHWFNRDYHSFHEFLDTMKSRKRKAINKERAAISQEGVEIRRVPGSDISQEQLRCFYDLYCDTYFKRGHHPHLNLDFFQRVVKDLPENILLVEATLQSKTIAVAWFFFDRQTLYGRYWGSSEQISGLHFECCYYQGIEFCIENDLQSFNPGTQGEHKISRGFEPVITRSHHWISNPEFRRAIENFVEQEKQHILDYRNDVKNHLPFRIE